jgi:flagellar protein FlgJ
LTLTTSSLRPHSRPTTPSSSRSTTTHGSFFTRNKRYRPALAVADDARAFAHEIQDDGYATDPSYGDKLVELMDRYDLYRFDE